LVVDEDWEVSVPVVIPIIPEKIWRNVAMKIGWLPGDGHKVSETFYLVRQWEPSTLEDFFNIPLFVLFES
jgi:hypothetical protein